MVRTGITFTLGFLASTYIFAQDKKIKETISHVLDAWHRAASEVNFDAYFGYMSKTGAFLGTDATENWQLEAFKEFSKPYFDGGRAWSFTAVERNIYLSQSKDIAWFDELLDTPNMKLCRGSGVLLLEDGQWRIAHYVLSIAVPNKHVKNLLKLKEKWDDSLIHYLRNSH